MLEKKIKIIYIIPTLDMGGAERLLVDIVKNLNQERFASKVVCLKKFGFWGIELKKLGVPLILAGRREKLGLSTFFNLVKILKSQKADIVHTHLFGADVFGIMAAKLAGVKVIVSTEHNLNYQENFFKKFIKRYTNIFADVIVAVSAAVKNYVVGSEEIKENKVEVIYNGVDIKKFLNETRNYKNGREDIIIGSLGRLTKQKGFDYLIEAIAAITGSGKIKCLIAGEGEKRKKLKKQIKKLNLGSRVELLGWRRDTKEFLNSLDIFVLPSRWEGFGIAILEAGLSGLPVVAAKVDGIREIIKDGEDGLLFAKGNIAGLTEKINYLVNSPEERKRLGLALQNKVKEKFPIGKIVKKYEDLYLKLLFK